MKSRCLLWLSLGLNAALAVTLWFAWTWPEAVPPPARPLRLARAVAPPEVVAPIPPVAVAPANQPRLRWGDLASTNFITYRDRLRAVGCPEATVRDILLAEINDHFLRRRQPIIEAFQPRFWDTFAQGGGDLPDSLQAQVSDLKEERRKLIVEVLGRPKSDPAAELASRRESFAERYDWLPAELQARLVDLEEHLWRSEVDLREEVAAREPKSWTAEEIARRKQLRAEFERDRKELLGAYAGEFDLRNSNAGDWASNLPGFEPTEDEWRVVAKAKTEHDKALQTSNPPGMMDLRMMKRYGMLPEGLKLEGNDMAALAITAEAQKERLAAWKAAEARHKLDLEAALGAARYAEYQRASDGDYRQTRRVTQRLGLDDQVAAETWEIQRAAQAAAEQLGANADLDAARRQAALEELRREAGRSLQQTLGSAGFDAYREYAGDWLRRGLGGGK